MSKNRFQLYKVNMKYIRNLANIDKHIMSVSPQTNKHERVFLGIVVMINGQKYCIPLSSNKGKFNNMKENITLRKIKDSTGNTLAVLNLNNMIPVQDEYLTLYDIKIHSGDSKELCQRKNFCAKELSWCQANQDEIERLCRELHRKCISGESFSKRSICLDFPALEKECKKAKST